MKHTGTRVALLIGGIVLIQTSFVARSETATGGAPVAQARTDGGADAIRPFHVNVPDEALADLKRRIVATRWPGNELVKDRSQGVQLATLRELARYWST